MLKFRKITAMICALSLMATMLITTVSADTGVPAEKSIWDGTTDQSFVGDGTAESPYLITSAAELAGLVTLGGDATSGNYYKLNTDVDLSFKDWYEGSFTSGTYKFDGNFDGAGHIVYGLKKTSGSGWGSCTGLFPVIGNNAHIKRVGIIGANITATNGDYRAGFIFGGAKLTNGWTDWNGSEMVSVDYCYVDSTSTISGGKSGGIGGAVVSGNGWQGYIRVSDCYTLAASPSSGAIGDVNLPEARYMRVYSTSGFKGHNAAYKVVNVYSSATLTQTDLDKGVVQLTEDQMTGAAAKANMTGFDFDKVWQLKKGAYPTLRVFGVDTDDTIDFWDGTTDQSFAGEGTAESPYLITSAAELAGLVTLGATNTTGNYYRLTTDVDLSYKDWYEGNFDNGTNKFDGTFDGAGHIVYGMKKTSGSGWGACTGLFPVIGNNTHIKRVGIIGANINSTNGDFGAGFIFGGAKLTNGWTDWNGAAMASVDYCYVDSTSTMTVSGYTGGIGGVVVSGDGWQGYIRVSDCYTLAQFGNAARACGAIGNIYTAKARYMRIYSTSDFVGANANVEIENVYSSAALSEAEVNKGEKQLTSAQMTGEAAIENMQGFDFDNVWQTVDGDMPTLRVFNFTSFEQPVTQVQISTDGTGTQNGTKFVIKNTFPGMSESDITANDITVKVEGNVKTVQETGIIIKRSVADDYALDEITNNPITGYRVKGYVKGAVDTAKLNIIESGITFGATVKGTNNYTAKTYTLFTDGTLVTSDIYLSDAASGNGSADGYTVNDKYDLGDANFDGSFNLIDLVRIKKYSAGTAGYKAGIIDDIVDVDGDGKLNASDITEVKKYLIEGKAFSSPAASDYKLVWEDNFDSAELNTANWGFIPEMGGYNDAYITHGSDVQSIAKNNSGESYLRLHSYYNGTDYVLPESVSTKETMNFTYGYVEMRAKLPTGAGVWPSFWLKSPGNTTAGYTTEVDIVEIFGNENVLCNMHKWGTEHDQLGATTTYTLSDGDWHTYGMKWDAEAITMYVDGEAKFTYSLNNNFGSENGMEGFKEPMYLIINNHLFTPGFMEEYKNPSWVTQVSEDFKESVYEIDYVRLYQNAEGSITIK